jgi:predicted enzyme related to lactoylglutathione lyase
MADRCPNHNTPIAYSVDECDVTYAELQGRGGKLISSPQEVPYGRMAVASDLYGNSLVFLQMAG